jgi:spore coat protein U-like protein
MNKKTRLLTALSLVVIVAFVNQAFVATTTANLSVTAIVGATCNISTSAVSFGSYDPLVANLTSPLNATGAVGTTCSNGLTNTITLDQGVNAATGSTDAIPLRQLRSSGSNVISYFLYSNSPRTTIFGNTTGTGVGQTGTGQAASATVYGQIPAGQNAAPGSYADTVVATVTF